MRENRKAQYMTVYTLTEAQAVKLDLLINKDEYKKEKQLKQNIAKISLNIFDELKKLETAKALEDALTATMSDE
jgi:hypothetical protein